MNVLDNIQIASDCGSNELVAPVTAISAVYINTVTYCLAKNSFSDKFLSSVICILACSNFFLFIYVRYTSVT